uniref:Lymphocyte antigen 6 complex locus protein G6c n=1 Tax=Caenorhabditis tropicalis TaxID=1561998 RepID=A0A1I7UAM8_9PELO
MKLITLALLVGVVLLATPALVPELRTWAEDRYVQCVHCMDYDRSHISLFGCKPRRPILCNGNACFMRFHKEFQRPSVMYTSGCLNLTRVEMETIAYAQKHSNESGNSNGTLLCEV